VTVRRSRLVALLAAIACVAVASAGLGASEAAPEAEVVRARLGAPTTTQDGQVTVDQVRVGTSLGSGGQVTDTTPGLFVVVRVRAAATGPRDQVFTDSRLLARGDRVYAPYDTTSARAAPGFVESVDYLYEVDPAGIDDLTLELWRDEIVHGYQQRVQVHLGITRANADAWRDAGARRVLEPDRYGTTRVLP
jgi:hypothetical protein